MWWRMIGGLSTGPCGVRQPLAHSKGRVGWQVGTDMPPLRTRRGFTRPPGYGAAPWRSHLFEPVQPSKAAGIEDRGDRRKRDQALGKGGAAAAGGRAGQLGVARQEEWAAAGCCCRQGRGRAFEGHLCGFKASTPEASVPQSFFVDHAVCFMQARATRMSQGGRSDDLSATTGPRPAHLTTHCSTQSTLCCMAGSALTAVQGGAGQRGERKTVHTWLRRRATGTCPDICMADQRQGL